MIPTGLQAVSKFLSHGFLGRATVNWHVGAIRWVLTVILTLSHQTPWHVPWVREYAGEMHQKAVEMGLGVLSLHLPGFTLDANETMARIEVSA